MVTAYQGSVRNGRIRLDPEQSLPEGAQVIVVVVSDGEAPAKSLTARELAESALVGLWADREDIDDSAAFARGLREQAQRRRDATS